MTRGDEDIEEKLRKFLDTRKGALRKIVGLGGGLLKIEPLARGAAKISSFKFQYLHPPPPLSY